jgi:hypothetical protein
MTNDLVSELAREFQSELLTCGVDQHTLERMIRRAIEPCAYLDFDAAGKPKWEGHDLEIDPLDTKVKLFEMRQMLLQNSNRCTCCRTVFAEGDAANAQVAARVYRDDVRTGILCTTCYGTYLAARQAKIPAVLPKA